MNTINTLKQGFFALALVLISSTALAQPPQGGPKSKKEKIEQLKIAFITKELDLSKEEAEKFWPVYNEMADELKEEKKSRRTLSKDLKENYEALSEADVKKKTLDILDSEIKEAELKKEYTEKIADIIGFKKATKLLSLEQRFKRELLNKLNESQKPPQGRKPGGPRSMD
jgi:hypothetical protein